MNFSTPTNKKTDTSIANLWYLLGLRSSLGKRVALLAILPGSLSPLFADRREYGGSLLLWIGIVVVIHLSLTVTLLIGRRLIHGVRKDESHPVLTVLVFLLAQAVRGLILSGLVVVLNLTEEPQVAYRLIAGGVYYVCILTALAISVAIFDSHSSLVKGLEQKQLELSALRETLDSRLQVAMSDLREFAINVLRPRISEIDQLLRTIKDTGDKNNALLEMQDYVEDELRPLSHRIAHDTNLNVIQVPKIDNLRKFALPKKFIFSDSVHPFLLTAVGVITSVAAAQRTMNLKDSIPYAVIFAVAFFGYSYVLKKIFNNKAVNTSAGIVVGLVLTAIAGPIAIRLASTLGYSDLDYLEQASMFVGLIFGLASIGFTILTTQRDEFAKQLEATVRQLSETVAILKQKEWVARRRISYVMHGTLQSSINAAVIRLGATQNPSPELIDQIRNDISVSLEQIWQDKLEKLSLARAQLSITQVWLGAVDVAWNVSAATNTILDLNPIASECLGEISREAVSNASKHGKATRVEITIEVDKSKVFFEAVDNGNALDTGKTQGLGSELLNEVCTAWSLTPTPSGGMKLSAELSLENG